MKTIIIATSGFDNIEGILRAWDVTFTDTKVEGMWIVNDRSSFLCNLFSSWEVKNYQISIWDKVN
jgi:hypothetical protein